MSERTFVHYEGYRATISLLTRSEKPMSRSSWLLATLSCLIACSTRPEIESTASLLAASTDYIGCYTDDANRALSVSLGDNFTPASCKQAVAALGYRFAGLQY